MSQTDVLSGPSRGRGRGRGRGLLLLKKNVSAILTSPPRVSINDWASQAHEPESAVSSMSSLQLPTPKATAPTARIKVKALNELDLSLAQVRAPICAKIQKVDVEEMFVYVKFETELSSIRLRSEMDSLKSIYESSGAAKYRLNIDDAVDGEILVVRDEQGDYHRGLILSVDIARRIGLALDVDDLQKITFDENSVFQLTETLLELPYDVVKCGAEINDSKIFLKWVDENASMFESNSFLNRSLFSALEMCEGRDILVSKIYRNPDQDCFTLGVEVLGTKPLKMHFAASLIYHSVPRTPAIGGKKTAWITNIRKDGKIDVVFSNKAWFGLREAIHEIQVEQNLFSPRSSREADFSRQMVTSFRTELFFAPMRNAWKELYRVKVLNIEEKVANVHYLDVGKVDSIPLEHLAVPLRARFVPEFMGLLPPMAFTVRVMENVDLDAIHLDAIRSLLESRPCYLKMVEDNSHNLEETPFVELYALLGQQVKSAADLIAKIAGHRKSDKRNIDVDIVRAVEPLIQMTETLQMANESRNARRLRCGKRQDCRP